MWPNPQETADLVTFTEEILNGKLHFLCRDTKDFCFENDEVGIKKVLQDSWKETFFKQLL